MGKKLIEVALPLEAINAESEREKQIRKGHPSTLHLWWARRPLAACRAVLFASLVDDPSSLPDEFPSEERQDAERQRLFRIIEDLIKWDNTANEEVLSRARAEIMRSTGGNPPPVLDPFAGGGSIPLEAQRLGLEAHASDLNPVAVLINRAQIEIPPRFANSAPVHPRDGSSLDLQSWHGAQGLAEDVRYYGQWMHDEAERRIGHLYPSVQLGAEDGGGLTAPIAWIWARTVTCPNPACGATMPLASTFKLSSRPARRVWVQPVVDRDTKAISYTLGAGSGSAPDPPKVGRGAKFRCIACEELVPDTYIKAEGTAGRMGADLMAVVAQGHGRRTYLAPTPKQVAAATVDAPPSAPDEELPYDPRAIWCIPYGLVRHRDLFTNRQLVALTTFSDLVGEAKDLARAHAEAAGMENGNPLRDGGNGAVAYSESIATYLAFAVDKTVDRNSTICAWETKKERLRGTFQRQAIPMAWDFTEANPVGGAGGDFGVSLHSLCQVLERGVAEQPGHVRQLDATVAVNGVHQPVVSTDPPYYDNIGYADLSDFFYVWLRRSMRSIYPDECSTLLVPKNQELIATPYRHGGDRAAAREHFESGLASTFTHIRAAHHPDYPLTIFYAFKQAESDGEGDLASTGWETMLQAVLDAGFSINGTWPMRTENPDRALASGTNALASSIVLVCRPTVESAGLATRREFIAALKAELPDALRHLQQGSIAPVDLAQAAIGPGIGVFSGFAKVVEADGSSMTVRTALGLINQVLDETLAEQEGDFDPDTRWAVAWFEQFGVGEAAYGQAETLSKAKNTSVQGLVDAGVLESKAGTVRLLDRDEMAATWDPTTDTRLTVWEVTQHLIRSLEEGGEQAAAALLRRVGPDLGETARELSYRLYTICERKKWSSEALAYNSLVVAWPQIIRMRAKAVSSTDQLEFLE